MFQFYFLVNSLSLLLRQTSGSMSDHLTEHLWSVWSLECNRFGSFTWTPTIKCNERVYYPQVWFRFTVSQTKIHTSIGSSISRCYLQNKLTWSKWQAKISKSKRTVLSWVRQIFQTALIVQRIDNEQTNPVECIGLIEPLIKLFNHKQQMEESVSNSSPMLTNLVIINPFPTIQMAFFVLFLQYLFFDVNRTHWTRNIWTLNLLFCLWSACSWRAIPYTQTVWKLFQFPFVLSAQVCSSCAGIRLLPFSRKLPAAQDHFENICDCCSVFLV